MADTEGIAQESLAVVRAYTEARMQGVLPGDDPAEALGDVIRKIDQLKAAL